MGSLLPKKTSTSLRKNPVTASTSPRSVAANSSVIASALSFMSVSGISCLPSHDQRTFSATRCGRLPHHRR
jgi:hypothetical protein